MKVIVSDLFVGSFKPGFHTIATVNERSQIDQPCISLIHHHSIGGWSEELFPFNLNSQQLVVVMDHWLIRDLYAQMETYLSPVLGSILSPWRRRSAAKNHISVKDLDCISLRDCTATGRRRLKTSFQLVWYVPVLSLTDQRYWRHRSDNASI